MAKKKAATRSRKTAAPTTPTEPGESSQKQAPSAEERYAEELAFLAAYDDSRRPEGWRLSPHSVVQFVTGSDGEALKLPKSTKADSAIPRSLAISEKFVGERALIERCVVTLAGERGLLLLGEP
ncbi:MAG: AAA family ATPase, partial [Planctomycetes bacterium]|nr:AAA family ATPase [Planctomycetota bacterium]